MQILFFFLLIFIKSANISGGHYIYIYIRGVNFNALTHVINLKTLTR